MAGEQVSPTQLLSCGEVNDESLVTNTLHNKETLTIPPPSPPSSPPPPQLFLSDFHVLEELFRSAAGAVFKVRRKKNRLLCVLKERKFAELGRKRDILNEVALLERLDHPNVIKCYGHFWDHSNGALYMVLEYADSGDLYSHVLKRRLVLCVYICVAIPIVWCMVV